jgi:hypothetical protein
MKTKNLLCALILGAGSFAASAQTIADDLIFTVKGSAASYLEVNNALSRQADSIYELKKTSLPITIDGVMDEEAWATAHVRVIKKIAHEKKADEELDLDLYPQSEEDLKGTFRALWTDDGVYMFIDVVDDLVRYQNPPFAWENDGIEFYFAKEPGLPHTQLIIPAMVGTPHPDKPAAKDFETGVQAGSDPDYKVHGADANWDESVFQWAIKKTATGYAMEVFLDADIVTKGNSATNFGNVGDIFAGEIAINEADTKQNTNDPALYVREVSLQLLGNHNQGWAGSAQYGYFKLAAEDIPGQLDFTVTGSAADYLTWNNWNSRQSDSIYEIKKTSLPITIDGVMDEEVWSKANARVIHKIAHEKKAGDVLDLDLYPQSEDDLHATFRALWNDDGVYMFIDVVDDLVRYQNPPFAWENDGVEFYFAKEPGLPHTQLIIPAMVGTPHPEKPAALDLETGVAAGSDPDYKVHGADANWDESVFHWAIKKTATGYAMEVFLDADIVTKGNSSTNFGNVGDMFAGEIAINEADTRQNTNDPALYVREVSLQLLANSNQGWAGSSQYGYFKLVAEDFTSVDRFTLPLTELIYDMPNRQIRIRNDEIKTVDIFNTLGQRVLRSTDSDMISVNHLLRGVYIVRAMDAKGNDIGVRKIMIQ